MTTSNVPPTPPADDELEARLHASWQHAMARAGDDLTRSDLVPHALAAGRRRQPLRVVLRLTLGAAAVLVLGLAIIVGSGGRRDPVEPPASPARPVGSPSASGSPAPTRGANPEQSGVPVLNRYQTFPPTVDGQRVVVVGAEADARIAAAADDSPIFVSGWLLGTDRTGCNSDIGTPAPNDIIWDDCMGELLRGTMNGGSSLPVFSTLGGPVYLLRPYPTRVQSVLVQVHVHDRGCTAPDCVHKAVLDRVLMYGAAGVAPEFLTATMPPSGLAADQAVAIARSELAMYPSPMVLLRVEAGPFALLGDPVSGYEDRWVWAVHLVSDDGYHEYAAYLDYLDGTTYGMRSQSVEPQPPYP